MMFSTRGRYAIRLMIDLAEHKDDGFVPLKDVAQRQDISKKYLESIVKELVDANMIVGVSGKGGGYALKRDATEYRIIDILETMEGSLAPVACLAKDAAYCKRTPYCKTLPMWIEFGEMVYDFFKSRRLSDLL
ncbi:MAG: Rrf2 family transcriptional regulator [Eggerthellaceae bacterium]|nr:Rrf2 family transcriptional regulator [Eggerthellaceae bacterium]